MFTRDFEECYQGYYNAFWLSFRRIYSVNKRGNLFILFIAHFSFIIPAPYFCRGTPEFKQSPPSCELLPYVTGGYKSLFSNCKNRSRIQLKGTVNQFDPILNAQTCALTIFYADCRLWCLYRKWQISPNNWYATGNKISS